MDKATRKKNESAEIVALRFAMARRGWKYQELAEALNVSKGTVENNFIDEFSSKPLRIRVNALFAPQVIFVEGVGELVPEEALAL